MKKKVDRQKLASELKHELGIDLEEYAKPEVIDNFISLLVFPRYAVSTLRTPVVVALLLYISGYWLLDLSGLWAVLYAPLGLVLFLVNGLLFGILLLLSRIKNDLLGILSYSLDITRAALSDISYAGQAVKKMGLKDVLRTLFKGIIHVVVIPTVSHAITKKVPLIGSLIGALTASILSIAVSRIRFEVKEDEVDEDGEPVEEGKLIQQVGDAISAVNRGADKFLSIAASVAMLPFRIVFTVTALMLGGLVWLLY